jgi:nitrate/nitrite transporter NarK
MACPFFGQNEDACDVGLDYISPHDVETISHYCSSRYRECRKFSELSECRPELMNLARRTRIKPQINKSPAVNIPFRNRWPLSFQVRSLCTGFDNPYQINTEEQMSKQTSNARGWIVALAGTGINLALGILYTWSIFKGAISDSIASGVEGSFNWDPASINDPYAVACLVFAVAMILAGKIQDKFGPRVTCIIGGLLVASGFVWISQTTSYWSWIAGFGVLAGMGIGFGYSAATPPALKWFSPAKTGLIAGIVVSGFGLASVYIAPTAKYLLGVYGLQQSMLFFGIAFAVIVCSFAMLISNPPAGYVPAGVPAPRVQTKSNTSEDLSPSQIIRTGKFYTLWLCFFIGAGAGLMVIGSAKGLAKASMGEMAFLVVAIMSIGNAAGRLIAGVVSDKIGRATTLTIMLAFQAVLMFAAIPGLKGDANPVIVTLLVTFMVFNYGTNLALFPSFVKDYWGMKHFGMNYGILFSAWGVGAFVLVRVAEMIKVKTGDFAMNFAVAGVLLLVGAMMAMSLRPKKAAVSVEVPATGILEEDDLALQRISE